MKVLRACVVTAVVTTTLSLGASIALFCEDNAARETRDRHDIEALMWKYTRALDKHLKLAEVFAMLKEVSAQPNWKTPLVAMASYSLMYRKGPAQFMDAAKAAGASGAVVPDVPVEEADELAKLARDRRNLTENCFQKCGLA